MLQIQNSAITGRMYLMASPSELPYPQHLAEGEKMDARRLLRALNEFGKVYPRATFTMAAAFLRVCISEGRSVSDYAREADVSINTMSRVLLDLGPMFRDRSEGLKLVELRVNPHNMKEKQVVLTRRGHEVAHAMLKALGHARSAA